jgi:CRP/FNR family transcriptional regulator, polysaccharide utilization system transcription regulator
MKTILVIEDNNDVRENIAEILELSNYNVLTAENGKIGVRLAQENMPDLIICDVMMPELDGFGVLHILTQNPVTAKIPFIFLTAKADKGDFRKGMNLGADDYLTKPFDDVELLNAIDIRFKKHSLNALVEANTPQKFVHETEAQCLALLKDMIEDAEVRNYHKRDTIFREGDYPRYIFYLHSGKIKLSKANDDGKEFILSLGKKGDYIGFLPLLQSIRYPENAIALEDCEVSLIPQQRFLDTLYDHPDLANLFIKILAQDLLEKEEQLVELAYNSVRKRVADALVRLQERYQDPSDKKFSMAILREDLASMVGTAKETVIRTLSDFRDENLIEMKGSKITILNFLALKSMLN